MQETYEVCKILIGTETYHRNNAQHMLATAINFYTQKQIASVEFDYASVFEREDKYKDVVGFFHTHPSGCTSMSQTDIDTMVQWVKCLGKALLCIIECDKQLYAWIFYKNEDKILNKEIKATTTNDTNYNIWLEASPNFWNSADFLLSEIEEVSEVELLSEMCDRLDNLDLTVSKMLDGLNAVSEGMKGISNSIDVFAEVQKALIDSLTEGDIKDE